MWFSKLKVLLLSCAFYLNFNFAQVRKANVNSMSPTPSALLLELSSQHSIGRSGKSWDEIAAESNYGLGSYKKPKPEPYYYKWEAPFGYGYKTGKMKASQSQDRNGVVTGSYSIMGPDELMREVVYRADESGYSATIRTNEPGSANVKINPANVVIISTATTSRPGGGSGGGMGNGGDYGSVSKPYYPTKAMTTTSLPWPPKPPTQIENNLEDNIKEIIEEYDYADIDVQDEYEDEFETSTEALFDDLVDERGPSLMFVSKRKNKMSPNLEHPNSGKSSLIKNALKLLKQKHFSNIQRDQIQEETIPLVLPKSIQCSVMGNINDSIILRCDGRNKKK